MSILAQAEADLRELLGILPITGCFFFLQGRATQQFAQIPLNLLDGRSADYIVTGSWSKKAYQEARRVGVQGASAGPPPKRRLYPAAPGRG